MTRFIMLRELFLVLFLTLTLADDQKDSLAPETSLVLRMFEEIGKHPELITERLSALAKTQEQKEAISAVRPLQVARATDGESPDTNLECVGCQLVFSIVPFLFGKTGLTFQSVQKPVSLICELVFAFIDSKNPFTGEILCESLIGSFGPHVESIAKTVTLSAQDSCYNLVYCGNNLVSLDIPGLISRFLSQRSSPTQDELAPRPFLVIPEGQSVPAKPSQRFRRAAAGVLKVVQITDVHVDTFYKVGAPSDCSLPLCCHQLPSHWPTNTLKGSAGPYGEYKCNVPPATLKLFLDKLRQLNPDVIIHSGDSPANTVWLETLQGQLNATKWVAEQLKVNFPNAIGIYATIGNHELYPVNMYHAGHPHTEAINTVFYDVYKDISHFTPEQEATIKYSGYYTIRVKPGLRVLSVNSLFGESSNWYNVVNRGEPHYKAMMEFMKTTLKNARNNNEKVIIIVHHPMADTMRDFDDVMNSIITEFQDIIILNVAGHKHIDEFRLVRNDKGEVFSVQHLSQSSNTFTSVNPGARVYYLDDKTFELLDYDQYYLDIKMKDQATVKKLYSAKEYYNMPDFSARSYLDFAIRMEKDDALFKKHFDNRKTMSGADGLCTGKCKISTLCRLTTSTKRHRDSCTIYGIQRLTYSSTVFQINSARRRAMNYWLIWIMVTTIVATYNFFP